ncbi:MAG: XTP/dITP diphosphatase [Halobacteriales archaeon]
MLRFVTTNEGKVREARAYLADVVDGVEAWAYDYPELQADDLATIAAHGARDAYAAGDGSPVFVEDSGLFVDGLGDFPGPYSSYVYGTIGLAGVWRLAEPLDDRAAAFRSVVGYCDGETERTFEGAVRGTIVEPRGDGGFGYDPVFEYDGRTFAELSTEEKNAVSHRGRALATFADWLAGESAEHKGAR